MSYQLALTLQCTATPVSPRASADERSMDLMSSSSENGFVIKIPMGETTEPERVLPALEELFKRMFSSLPRQLAPFSLAQREFKVNRPGKSEEAPEEPEEKSTPEEKTVRFVMGVANFSPPSSPFKQAENRALAYGESYLEIDDRKFVALEGAVSSLSTTTHLPEGLCKMIALEAGFMTEEEVSIYD